MRMLVIIYGEEGINKSFSTKNFELFDKELTKYGYSIDNVNKFKMMMDNYYKLDMGQKDRVVKKKNKFFNAIQKLLIDMMVTKNNHGEINLDELVDLADFDAFVYIGGSIFMEHAGGIERIEKLIDKNIFGYKVKEGYAIFLTNDFGSLPPIVI